MLTISPRTVQRIVARGELPVVRIGRSRRFIPGDIDRYIRGQRTRHILGAG